MKSPNTKTSDQLQKEVRAQMSTIKSDLDQIERRLTPGQIIDDVLFYPQGKNLRGTLGHLKDNPVGTSFLTLGTLLLMENGGESNEKKMKSQLGTTLTSTKKNIKSGLEQVQSRIGEIKDKSELKEKGKKVSQTLSQAKEKLTDFGKTTKERFGELDPVVYSALGLGLGALSGASLPLAEKETQFVDEKFKEKFSHLSEDLKAAVNESTDILKNLILDDVKDVSVHIF